MRFSLRSKVKIALSLFILITVVGAFVAMGLIRGSATRAHAATGPRITTGHLKALGTTSIRPTKAATSGGNTNLEIGPSIEVNPHSASGSGSGGSITPPNPPGNTLATSNPGFSGFPGLNHADQRLANNGNQFSLEPPDQGLCVGNGFVMETINDVLAVYTTNGHVIVKPTTTMNSFFNLAPQIIRTTPPTFGPFLSDPKCYFDHATQRWFLTVLEIDVDPFTGAFLNNAHQLFAVSQTSNPTGLFGLFEFSTNDDGTNGTPVHPNCPCFGDQPLFGADANGIYISTNEFSISGTAFNGAQIYALSKSGVEAAATGGPLPTLVHIDTAPLAPALGGVPFSIQPAESPDAFFAKAQNGTEYFLSSLDFNSTFANTIATWALTNTASLSSATPSVSLSFVVINSELYGQPPNAKQKPGPRPLGKALGAPLELIASNDDRMNQVVFAQNLLWSGVNTIVQVPGHPARVGIAFFIVAPSMHSGHLQASIASQGYVSVTGENVLFPSIGVTADGQGVMSFTLVGPDFFPSAAYTPISATGKVGNIHIAGAGAFPEDGFSGYAAFGGAGVARWGDYTAAVADSGVVWLAAEFIPNAPRTTLANWGTFISRVNPNISSS